MKQLLDSRLFFYGLVMPAFFVGMFVLLYMIGGCEDQAVFDSVCKNSSIEATVNSSTVLVVWFLFYYLLLAIPLTAVGLITRWLYKRLNAESSSSKK